ncbi:MAG: hypothetical protein FWD31_03580, partial [Planctomycetaceae bacterium]|nr:hypothetical protein [Planctomycetaceae bacterium]
MTNEPSSVLPKITPEENQQQPTWKFGCWTYFCVIAFALIVLVWFNIFRSGPPLRIAKETTYIIEPLTPDGLYVDYFAALEQRVYPPTVLFGRSTGIATDDNGYRVVFRALGDFGNETKDFELLKQRYEKLGLDVIRDKPTLTFVEPHFFLVNRIRSNPEDFDLLFANMDEDAKSNFRFDQPHVMMHPDFHKLPIVQEWREANNAALDLVAEQVKKPFFFPPFVKRNEKVPVLVFMHIPGWQEMRSFARGFHTRVVIRINEGDIDGAIDDALACYRLARHAEQQVYMSGGLVGIALEGIAQGLAFDGQSESRANAGQLKRLQEGIAALSPYHGLAEKLEHERYMCLDAML